MKTQTIVPLINCRYVNAVSLKLSMTGWKTFLTSNTHAIALWSITCQTSWHVWSPTLIKRKNPPLIYAMLIYCP
jgi:hypothetical protein